MLDSVSHQRYLRNILVPEIEVAGQLKLLNSKVLVIGAGGLGSSILFYLSASGIGNIGIVDDDKVEISNLQRQILHNQNDLGKSKVISAKEKILALNDQLKIDIYQIRASFENLIDIAKNYQIIIDASDNFKTRYLINQVSFDLKIPMIYGAVKCFEGQSSIFKPYLKNQPCYQCFNPNIAMQDQDVPLSQKGIIGAVAGNIGTIQAINTIKEILQIGESLVGKILINNFLTNHQRIVLLKKNPDCKICQI
jgi:adenylyltransferase/sulfurtransferase